MSDSSADSSADSSGRSKREDYAMAHELFNEGLNIAPEHQAAWIERQTEYSRAARELALAMLRSDRDCEEDKNSTAAESQVPETIAQTAGASRSSLPTLENYEILEEIARGGMGIVYKARQIRPNRLAAIKMIRSGAFASKKEIDRFMTEAEAAAQLDDESVVPVYELGAVNGEPFIAMKFIDGEDLETLLEQDELDREESLSILLTVCRAVAAAHARDIVHRDLKPSNILVDRSTHRPWITDFGLAKYLNQDNGSTAAGEVLGTPGYMAPEQVMDDAAISKATDVYGLGAILYRILTGRPPIHMDTTNLAEMLQLIREHDVTSPKSIGRSIPGPLNIICMRCLETDPARRYAEAGELADDLERFFEGEAIQAKPLSLARQIHRWVRHRPGLAMTWCAVAIFYIYHHIFRLVVDSRNDAFNTATTIVVFSIAATAWFWQRCLIRSSGAAWVLYAWVTSDLLLLTGYLFYAGGVNSSLIVLYPVVVAGSVLRCRADLVAYVTALAMLCYGVHFVWEFLHPEGEVPLFARSMPFLLSLLIIGIIQYYSLSRSASSMEAKAAGRRV